MKLRNEIDDKFKWHLNDLFDTDELWQNSYDELNNSIALINSFRGKLNDLQILKQCLEKVYDIYEKLGRVYVYAQMKLHEDANNNFYQAMADKSDIIRVKIAAAASFIEPEILNLSEEQLKTFIESNNLYAHFMENLLRMKKHILSPEIEKILTDATQLADAPDNIYSMLSNADMNFGKIKISDGKEIELTHGKFISLMESSERDVRRQAFNVYYDAYINQKNTIATIYSSSVKNDVFFARTRNFDSVLSKALFIHNIPENVYSNLIETVNEYLPDLHGYIDIRKKLLGLQELHMYDMYVPIVPEIDTQISFDEAKETVKKALQPLGNDYVAKLDEAFNSGWIDVYENKGKRSGAYSWGAYGCHPFVLLNFDGKIEDMFTLAHEMGHAMHSFYSWSNQPYIYADYTIFLAEIASTVNETLLMQYLLKTTEDKKFKSYLINYFLEQFRRTLYRQTMFAEFEMQTHDMVQKDIPLTVDLLNKTYRDLNLKYHGKSVTLDEKSDIEWSRIPHFYNAFYVYQYATGYSSAIALSQKILSGDNSYRKFLQSGSSNYSIEILKNAGVDMTTPAPIKSALEYFKELVEQMKKISEV